jgi:hypothetical protein
VGPGADRHFHPGWPHGRGWYDGPDWHSHGGHGGHGWHGHGGPGWHGAGWDGGPSWWDWWPLLPTMALAVLVLVGMVLLSQRGAALLNRTPLLSGPGPFAPDPASHRLARWEQAVQRYRSTAQAYAEFECDLRAVLRLPALADVTHPATARFVDAFAEATALCTDRFPGPEYAQRFGTAAEHAERAWAAAVDAAERVRDARFAPGERRLVEQVSTLLELAMASPYEAERRGAYRRVVRKLAELERSTGWRLPRPAAAELAHRARPQLVSAVVSRAG